MGSHIRGMARSGGPENVDNPVYKLWIVPIDPYSYML